MICERVCVCLVSEKDSLFEWVCVIRGHNFTVKISVFRVGSAWACLRMTHDCKSPPPWGLRPELQSYLPWAVSTELTNWVYKRLPGVKFTDNRPNWRRQEEHQSQKHSHGAVEGRVWRGAYTFHGRLTSRCLHQNVWSPHRLLHNYISPAAAKTIL